MNLRHLETFVKIAEMKSFTKASEELSLTQPTVSKQVLDLEQALKVRLMDRTKRSVALTRAGEILLRYAKEFLALQKEVLGAMEAYRGLKEGVLSVGASNVPGVYILPRILRAFRTQFEGIRVIMKISDSAEVTAMVDQGDLDMGFVGAMDRKKKVTYRAFLEDLIVMIGPPDYPDSISMDRLKEIPLLSREKGSGTRRCFEAALKEGGIALDAMKTAVELGSTEAVKEAVREGMGIAYVSKRAIDEEVARGHVKIISVQGMAPARRSFYVINRKGRSLSPQAQALLKIIGEWRQNG
jgi:DNA-binding transcriptional LysR family regulator